MGRAIALSDSATYWPSAVYRTTSLELVRDGSRLLVDPGVALWEIEEMAADGVQHVVLTHADWDHVLGLGVLPDAQVVATGLAAGRLAAEVDDVRREAEGVYLEVEALDGMRVDLPVEPPVEVAIGPWHVRCLTAAGHSPDGLVTAFADESLLVVGDHLSLLEIPFVEHSARAYRTTLQMLIEEIGSLRPDHVVIGHGHPHTADQALAVAAEDLAYIEALLAFAEAGGTPAEASSVAHPHRSNGDEGAHGRNVETACKEAAGA